MNEFPTTLGWLVYKRTYARPKPNGTTEEFHETVNRIITACRTQLKVGFTPDEEEELRSYLLKLKGMVAGRFLWQLGTATVNSLGLLSLQNCAFTTINHPIRPFTWAMDALMLGSGVGFNIQKEYVYELPKVRRVRIVRQDTKDAGFIVPDSREGWVELLRRTLEAHFITGQGFSYSTICIRGKGTPIAGFGGVASGPEPLAWGIEQINQVLNKRAGKKIRSIDALDVMNIIGYIVVAGNVRRSAQIAIGDFDDELFLNAKRWDLGNIPNWRAMSNNSVVCNDFSRLPEAFWEGYKGNGEPYGLINLKLAREVGRLGETQYPDPDIAGFNPCAEQPLAPYETCCLSEIYLPNVDTFEELCRLMVLLYRINKHSLTLKCHLKETEEIVHKHMRMGIGVTGYLQATEEQRGWLSNAYNYLRGYDRQYSESNGFNPSIKLTTVKPSGTLSLLANTTAGAHPGYSRFYIRRVRISSDSPLLQVCRDGGFPVEPQKNFDGTLDHLTSVVEFPCEHPAHTVLAEEVSSIDQLEVVRKLQQEWSDNAVSCTVYYKPTELPAIKEYLSANYNTSFKSLSFLLHSDHGFIQAPLEPITKEEYKKRVAVLKPLDMVSISEDALELQECESGHCPIR